MLGFFALVFLLVNLILAYYSLNHGIGKSNRCSNFQRRCLKCMCHYWSYYPKLSGHTTFQITYAYK